MSCVYYSAPDKLLAAQREDLTPTCLGSGTFRDSTALIADDKAYLAYMLDDDETLSRTMLANSGFENGLAEWTWDGGDGVMEVADGGRLGQKYIKWDIKSGTTYANKYLRQYVRVLQGTDAGAFNFSADFRTASGNHVQVLVMRYTRAVDLPYQPGGAGSSCDGNEWEDGIVNANGFGTTTGPWVMQNWREVACVQDVDCDDVDDCDYTGPWFCFRSYWIGVAAEDAVDQRLSISGTSHYPTPGGTQYGKLWIDNANLLGGS